MRDDSASDVVCTVEEDPARTRIHDVNFRNMVRILTVMGMLAVAVGGATSGSLTALEANFGITEKKKLATILVSYDIGALLIGIPSGFLGGRHIPQWVGGGFVVGGVSIMLFGMVSDFYLFCITQAFAGAGMSIIWILGCCLIDSNIHNKAAGLEYTGWLMSLGPFGVILGLMMAGAFLSQCTEGSEGGNDCIASPNMTQGGITFTEVAPMLTIEDCSEWRWSFILIGVLIIPMGLWFSCSRRRYKSPKTAKCCGPLEFEPHHVDEEALHPSWAELKDGLRHLITNKRLMILIIGSAVHTFQSTAIIAFGPRFIEKQLCVKRSTASLLTGTLIPVISIGVFLGGYIPQRYNWGKGNSRKPIFLMAITTLLSCPLCLLSFAFKDVVPFLLVVSVAFSLMFVMSAPIVTSCERVVPDKYKSLAVALQNIVARGAGAIPGPIVLSALLDMPDVGSRTAFISISVVGTFIAGCLWLFAAFLQAPYDKEELEKSYNPSPIMMNRHEQVDSSADQIMEVDTYELGMVPPVIIGDVNKAVKF